MPDKNLLDMLAQNRPAEEEDIPFIREVEEVGRSLLQSRLTDQQYANLVAWCATSLGEDKEAIVLSIQNPAMIGKLIDHAIALAVGLVVTEELR